MAVDTSNMEIGDEMKVHFDSVENPTEMEVLEIYKKDSPQHSEYKEKEIN